MAECHTQAELGHGRFGFLPVVKEGKRQKRK